MRLLQRLIKLFGGGADAELNRVRALVFALTAAGRRELETDAHGLDTRLRALLKLANGKRDGLELLASTESMGVDEVSLLKLYAWGYVESTSEDENQRLEHLIATMDGMQAPGVLPPDDPGRTLSFKVLDPERMAEEAARLDNSIQRRKKASAAQQRKRIEVEGLNAFGIQMLADLNCKGITVDHLEELYPNLVNRLALAFGQPREFIAMVDSLMMDSRGGREGFPLEVIRDLDALKTGFIHHFVPPGERSAYLEDKPRMG